MEELTVIFASADARMTPEMEETLKNTSGLWRGPDSMGRAWVGRSPNMLEQYDQAYRETDTPYLAYLHDDLAIQEPDWDERVLEEFEDPRVGLVGFGGALGHGSEDLYKTAYHLGQLGRETYLSNMEDAEAHGGRFTGSRTVAVLDGFALFVRRELLDRMGGWQPEKWPPFHVYDYRVSCEAHRHGYSIRLVGVACLHRGGQTSTRAGFEEWAATTKWGSGKAMHEIGHKMIYDEYRDVLPWRSRK